MNPKLFEKPGTEKSLISLFMMDPNYVFIALVREEPTQKCQRQQCGTCREFPHFSIRKGSYAATGWVVLSNILERMMDVNSSMMICSSYAVMYVTEE